MTRLPSGSTTNSECSQVDLPATPPASSALSSGCADIEHLDALVLLLEIGHDRSSCPSPAARDSRGPFPCSATGASGARTPARAGSSRRSGRHRHRPAPSSRAASRLPPAAAAPAAAARRGLRLRGRPPAEAVIQHERRRPAAGRTARHSRSSVRRCGRGVGVSVISLSSGSRPTNMASASSANDHHWTA